MSKSQTITGQLEAMPGGPPSGDAVGLICQPADYRAIAPVAKHEGLKLFRDTAQGFGGVMDGKRAPLAMPRRLVSFRPSR
jgi:dTDP-4-amino-4,6-dideoxygalactose transaminase